MILILFRFFIPYALRSVRTEVDKRRVKLSGYIFFRVAGLINLEILYVLKLFLIKATGFAVSASTVIVVEIETDFSLNSYIVIRICCLC